MHTLQLIAQKDINLKKWDHTILQSENSRIYAYSWYLDIVAPKWNGLVYGDYEYIMPVIQSKKYGLKYIYQPTYAQQHGIFPNPNPNITKQFLQKLAKLAPILVLAFNSENKIVDERFELSGKPNYLLPLNKPYAEIKTEYSKSHKRGINSAKKNIKIINQVGIEQFINLKQAVSEAYINNNNIEVLKKILTTCIKKGMCEIIGALDTNNELCATAVFIRSGSRLIYLNGTSNAIGKKYRAMFAVFDYMIQQYAGENISLDFEGSSIPGIADFFKRFGSKPEYYTVARKNSIPLLKHFIK